MSRLFKIILNIELHLMKAIVIYREEIEKMKNHIRQADQTFNTKVHVFCPVAAEPLSPGST